MEHGAWGRDFYIMEVKTNHPDDSPPEAKERRFACRVFLHNLGNIQIKEILRTHPSFDSPLSRERGGTGE